MSDLLIETVGLGKDYRLGSQVVPALRDVSIGVSRGEFVAIMGPSGSGKSTLMNLLGCLSTPSAGRYLLNKVDVGRLNRSALARMRNANIGFVFQSFNLLARASALENVELPLLYAGIPYRERCLRAKQALAAVNLAERAQHQPSQLSGGQQQRVAIARALVNHPSLLLADEPTGALDSHTEAEIMAMFQQLNQQGITIVLVTHETDVARYARRVLRFRDGRLVDDLSTLDEQPQFRPGTEDTATR